MSTSSLPGRKHSEAECEGCALYNEPYVANDLPQGAKVAFIAEAPSFKEVKVGKPLTGNGGKLLQGAAKAAGIEGPTASINLVACKPKKKVTPNDVHRCSQRLASDLASMPELETVVTLGNTVTKHFTGEDKITKARVGQPRKLDYLSTGEPLKVVPTFHPAACLRQGDNYPSMLFDLTKVSHEPPQWEEPEWLLLDDPEDVSPTTDLLASLAEYDTMPLALDIEVGIEKDTHFGHPEHYQLLCIGLAWEGMIVVIGERALQNRYVVTLLEEIVAKHQLICHNGKFDLTLWPDADLFFDTMLASYIRDERPGTNSLEYNAVEILGSPNWKDEVGQYLGPEKNYATIPRDILYKYNAFDMLNTWLLYKYFDEVLTPEERANHDLLCRLSQVLMHAEMKGSRIDEEYLTRVGEEIREKMDALETTTQRWVDNPRSPKQVKEAFEALGYKLSGTAEDILTDLRRRARPEAVEFIDALLSYRGEQKLHSTYVKGIQKRLYGDRLHFSYLIHGTTTGRLAGRNPNIMNQPRGPLIRSAFVPDKGFVYVQADYATAELRVIGVESGDPWLIEVLSDPNRDIHGEVADQFYGPGQWNKDQRVRAKAVVFGVSYDRQAESIAFEYGISKKEAQGAIDAFFSLMPVAAQWREDCVRRIFKEGWDPVNHFGRKRRFHLITKENMKDVRRQALAFLPQSTANDICFRAAVRIWEKYRLDIRILVHDSILVQARPDEAHDIGKILSAEMRATAEEEYSDVIPFYVDYEVGPSWGALVEA